MHGFILNPVCWGTALTTNLCHCPDVNCSNEGVAHCTGSY